MHVNCRMTLQCRITLPTLFATPAARGASCWLPVYILALHPPRTSLSPPKLCARSKHQNALQAPYFTFSPADRLATRTHSACAPNGQCSGPKCPESRARAVAVSPHPRPAWPMPTYQKNCHCKHALSGGIVPQLPKVRIGDVERTPIPLCCEAYFFNMLRTMLML